MHVKQKLLHLFFYFQGRFLVPAMRCKNTKQKRKLELGKTFLNINTLSISAQVHKQSIL